MINLSKKSIIIHYNPLQWIILASKKLGLKSNFKRLQSIIIDYIDIKKY